MGPVVIIVVSKLLKGALLLALGPPWRGGGGLFERPMQAFMPTILLRVPRRDPLRPDAQANPPDGQPRHPPVPRRQRAVHCHYE
jgi:hypothetical protein